MAYQKNHSLTDGLACLQALAGRNEAIGCRELARSLGLETTRTNRLLRTLAEIGMVEQDERRRYRPSAGIHVLAAQALHGSLLLRAALPVIQTLGTAQRLVALGVLWRDTVSYLWHGHPGNNLAAGLGAVGVYPAIRSSIGQVCLAERDDAYLEQFWTDESARDLGGLAGLRRRLAEVRRLGYAACQQGNRTWSIAVTVGSPALAGLALANVPPETDVAALAAELAAAATILSSTLSHLEP